MNLNAGGQFLYAHHHVVKSKTPKKSSMGPVSTFCLLFIVSEIGTGFPIGALRGSGHPQWQALESCSNATICYFDGLSPPRSTRRRAPEHRAARPCHDGSA